MNSSELALAAFGDRAFLESLWNGEFEGWDNGVFWYTRAGVSAGFAADALVELNPGPGDKGLYNKSRRLSWRLDGAGGYRVGETVDLESSSMWLKIVMYGPVAKECVPTTCGEGNILKISAELPLYCIDTTCTEAECCRKAKTCTNDVCGLGYFPKPNGFPPFCPGSFCLTSDCCVEAPRCNSDVCPGGYLLKRGQFSPYGCVGYTCTIDECCEVAPVCPLEFCAGDPSLIIKFSNPTPNCTDYDCSKQDCCKNASLCQAALCPKSYSLLPVAAARALYCADTDCKVEECCTLQPPTVPATSVRMQDMDLEKGQLGGIVTWVPAESEEVVTFYSVWVGASTSEAVLVGNNTAKNATVVLPAGTVATVNDVPVRIFVYAGNRAGLQASPAIGEVADAVFAIGHAAFADLDLDSGEIGGVITWADPVAKVRGPEAVVCRRNTSIGVDVGGASPLIFTMGGEEFSLPASDAGRGGFMAVAVLARDDPSLSAANVRVFDLDTEADDVEIFIETAKPDAPVLVAAWGNVSATNISNSTLSAMRHLGAREFGDVSVMDAYALVGRKSVPETGGVGGVLEMLTRSGSGRRASAELRCPLERIDVYLATERGYGGLVGSVSLADAPEMIVSAETPLLSLTQVMVRTASSFVVSTTFTSAPIVDVTASVSDIGLELDQDSDIEFIAGTLSWTPPNTSSVTAYRVFIGSEEVGLNHTRVGKGVPFGTDEFVFPNRVTRGNATHVSVYTVSALALQTTPASIELVGATYNLLALTIAVVATAAALHFVRVVVAVELASQATSATQKQSTDNLVKVVPPTTALGKFESIAAHPPVAVQVRRASCEIPIVREVLNTWFPSHVHHHASSVLLYDSMAAQRLYRHPACHNTWDAEGIMLRKLSNSTMLLHRGSEKVLLRRRLPRYLRRIESERFRTNIRIYGPLFGLLCLSFCVLAMEELYTSLMLLLTNVTGFGLVFLAARIPLIREVQRALTDMPPQRIRRQFWMVLGFAASLLPMVPAIMTHTTLGYILAAAVFISTLVAARGAPGPACLLEVPAALALAAASIALRTTSPAPNTVADDGSAARYMATFFASVLMGIRGIDDLMAHYSTLLDLTQLDDDDLVQQAKEDSDRMPKFDMHRMLVLEAFAIRRVEPRMHQQMPAVLNKLSQVLVRRAQSTLKVFVNELHAEGSRFAEYPRQLGVSVGAAIDAVGADLGLSQLEKLRHADHHESLEGDEKHAASKVFRKKTSPGLAALEDTLRELMTGPLSQQSVAQGQQVLQVMRTSLAALESELSVASRCVGEHGPAGDRGKADALAHHAELLSATAQILRQEVGQGSISPMDLRVLVGKIEQMTEQVASAERVVGVVGNSGPRRLSVLGGHSDLFALPKLDLQRARNILEALRDAAGSIERSPGKAQLSEMAGNMDVVLKAARNLRDFRRDFCENTPQVGVIEKRFKEECEAEVSQRLVGRKTEDLVRETADALAMTWNVVGLAGIMLEELTAMVDRIGLIFKLLGDAQLVGGKTLHAAERVRERLPKFVVADVQRLQSDAIDFATGLPVKAVTRLQDLLAEPTRKALTSYQDELRHFLVLLSSPPSTPREAFAVDVDKGRLSSRGSTSSTRPAWKSAGRVQPTLCVPEEEEAEVRAMKTSPRASAFQQELRRSAAEGLRDSRHQPAT